MVLLRLFDESPRFNPRRRRAGEVLCTMFLISETSRATGMPQVSAAESLVSGAARLTAVRRERE